MAKDQIVWYSGGCWGSTHDMKIARQSFVRELREGEAVVGDKAYQGSYWFISPFKGELEPGSVKGKFNSVLEKERKRVERTIRRLKIWKCLKFP